QWRSLRGCRRRPGRSPSIWRSPCARRSSTPATTPAIGSIRVCCRGACGCRGPRWMRRCAGWSTPSCSPAPAAGPASRRAQPSSRAGRAGVLPASPAPPPQRYLLPVPLALRQVAAAAPSRSGIDVEDADLHFQQELARASGLRESARAFESLTLRLRLFISVLQLDYSPASDRIVSDDRAIFRSLARADARTAIEVWRGKVDNAVRHMAGLLGRRRFDQELWTQLTRSLG